MHVRVRIRVHVTGGVLARGLTCVGRLSEQTHWRWPKQGAAVAKQGGLGELSGLCKVRVPSEKAASGGCSPISTNHVALFGLSCTYSVLPCTLLWPYSNKVYLVLATALCFILMRVLLMSYGLM